jgi:hypothetical protein
MAEWDRLVEHCSNDLPVTVSEKLIGGTFELCFCCIDSLSMEVNNLPCFVQFPTVRDAYLHASMIFKRDAYLYASMIFKQDAYLYASMIFEQDAYLYASIIFERDAYLYASMIFERDAYLYAHIYI